MILKQIKLGIKGNAAGVVLLTGVSFGSKICDLDQWLVLLNWFMVSYLVIAMLRTLGLRSKPQLQINVPVPDLVADVMDVTRSAEHHGISCYSGKLRQAPQLGRQMLREAYNGEAVPLLQDTWSGHQIMLIPGRLDNFMLAYRPRPILHLLLGIITVVSTTFAGAHHLGYNGLNSLHALQAGLSYSIPLLIILGIHETGHFVIAKCHGMAVTPPFFIPVPFGLGTLGAVIQIRSPAMDQESLFDMAVAGPLAGFIASIPIILLGLRSSTIVHPLTPQLFMTGTFWEQIPVSSSILLSSLTNIACGNVVQYGDLLKLSPLALAGWIGLWVTAFNLLPIGQLDGGPHQPRYVWKQMECSPYQISYDYTIVSSYFCMVRLFSLAYYSIYNRATNSSTSR